MENDAYEKCLREILEIDKHKWAMYDGEDPYKEWNDCNAEWAGTIERLARIHGIPHKSIRV